MAVVPQAERQWWPTFQQSPIAMALVGLDGSLLAVNDAYHRLLGYDADAIGSLTVRDITHPEDVPRDDEQRARCLRGTISSFRHTKRYRHADGRMLWVDLSVSLLRGDDGSPVHFIAQLVDLTAQLSALQQLADAEAEIEEHRRRTQAVYDTVDVGLVLLDADGNYETANQRQADFLDLAYPEGHRGRAGQLGDVYAEDGVTLMRKEELPTSRAVLGEEYDDLRMWIGADPAERRAISVSARSIRDESGAFAGAVLAYKDVTEYLRAATIKDEFVASVSHELRTPMTSILGHLEILAEGTSLPEEAMARIKTIERNALRLRRLVTDLLEVQRDSVAGLQLDIDACDLSVIVREGMEAAGPWARAASIALSCRVPDSLTMLVDPDRFRQVVDNLVSNAIKYSEPGGSVDVSLTASADEVELCVTDTGIGIPEDELPRLFTRFHRGKVAQEQQIPGTGLGLNIIRAIVEAHGGAVEVTSRPGEGTSVRATFPRRRP